MCPLRPPSLYVSLAGRVVSYRIEFFLGSVSTSKDQPVNLQRVQGHPLPGVGLGVSPGLKVEPGAVLELTQAVPGARQPAEASPVVPWRRLKLSSRPLPP